MVLKKSNLYESVPKNPGMSQGRDFPYIPILTTFQVSKQIKQYGPLSIMGKLYVRGPLYSKQQNSGTLQFSWLVNLPPLTPHPRKKALASPY